jgi:hypothetical protein
MCAIVSLYKGHAMTEILVIYFVSCLAPEGAEAGTADKQHKTQIMLKFVMARPLYSQGSQRQVCKGHAMTHTHQ